MSLEFLSGEVRYRLAVSRKEEKEARLRSRDITAQAVSYLLKNTETLRSIVTITQSHKDLLTVFDHFFRMGSLPAPEIQPGLAGARLKNPSCLPYFTASFRFGVQDKKISRIRPYSYGTMTIIDRPPYPFNIMLRDGGGSSTEIQCIILPQKINDGWELDRLVGYGPKAAGARPAQYTPIYPVYNSGNRIDVEGISPSGGRSVATFLYAGATVLPGEESPYHIWIHTVPREPPGVKVPQREFSAVPGNSGMTGMTI